MLSFAKSLAGLVVAILLLIPSNLVSANSPNGIKVSPPLKDITFGPGLLQANTTVSLTNNTEYSYKASIKLVDFKSLNENGGVSLEQAGSKYGLANWMSLDGSNDISIGSGQTVNLKIIIDNRNDLSPGGHYGAVLITASSNSSNLTYSKVGLNEQLASLIFLKKTDGAIYGLDLLSATPDNTRIPNYVTLNFKGTGNVYVVPHGYVELFDPSNKLIKRGIINQEDSLIMQGNSRQFITNLYSVGKSNLAGKYKLIVHYRHDDQTNYNIKTFYFNKSLGVSKPLIALILILILIGSLFMYRHHKLLRKTKPKMH